MEAWPKDMAGRLAGETAKGKQRGICLHNYEIRTARTFSVPVIIPPLLILQTGLGLTF